jgi:hypothetical protein
MLIKLEKCKFYKKVIAFLRFVIRQHSILIDPEKCQAV